eukprot:1317429-Amorphochlora_amoeboformis.AAC.1
MKPSVRSVVNTHGTHKCRKHALNTSQVSSTRTLHISLCRFRCFDPVQPNRITTERGPGAEAIDSVFRDAGTRHER